MVDGKKKTLEHAYAGIAAMEGLFGFVLVEDAMADPSKRIFAAVSLATASTLIERTKPRIVYLSKTAFDLDREIGRALDARKTGGDRAIEAGACRKALDGHARRQGRLAAVTCCLSVDGVLHAASEREEWYEAFLAGIGPAVDSVLEALGDAAAGEARKALKARALALSADPRFGAPKVTKGKREFLAGEIFPELGEKACARIVEEAENMAWLASVSEPAAAGPDAAKAA